MFHPPPLLAREAATLRPEQRRGVGALILGLHVAAAWGLLQSHVAPERVRDAVPVFFQMINLAPSTPHRPAPPPAPAAQLQQRLLPALTAMHHLPTPLAVTVVAPSPAPLPNNAASEPAPRPVAPALVVQAAVAPPPPVVAPPPQRIPPSAVLFTEPPQVKARLEPHTENGQPVEGWARIPIDFDLET